MCTSPLIRFRLKRGVSSDTIIGNSSSFQIKSLRELEGYFLSYSAFKDYFDKNMDYQYIKCRKCIECRSEYSQEWSLRCFHEFMMTPTGSSFITLTIDSTKEYLFHTEKNLKHYCKRCKNGNRYIKYPIDYTLSKGLIQDFLKRLRDTIYKRTGITIRYFGCGEYGSEENSNRPHYHVLIFGYPFPDKKPIELSHKGVQMFHSEFLQNQWKYGLCTIQEVNHRACMYTAKYCMKKIQTNNDISIIEQYYGREPEFLFMSKGACRSDICPYIDDIIKNCKHIKSLRDFKNPYCKQCKYKRGGIGFSWFLKYFRDVLQIGYCTVDGIKYSIPKYYIELLKLTDYEMYDKYKIKLLNRIDELEENETKERSQERLDIRNKIKKARLKLSHRE